MATVPVTILRAAEPNCAEAFVRLRVALPEAVHGANEPFSNELLVYSLYMVLGIFIPLIVTNCIVLARIEAFASKNPALESALDGLAMGLGLTAVLAVLGGLREVLGHGTLLSGIDMVFGDAAKSLVITVVPNYHGFLLAILPPGAFITLGMLIAGKNWLNLRAQNKAPATGAITASSQLA